MSVNAKKHVRVYYGVTKDNFAAEISPKREPAILRGLDIGSASSKWTPEYLALCGGVSHWKDGFYSQKLCLQEEKYYLRSLGDDSRKIMDNLLIQVTGHKRVVLYSPTDATKLYLNGDKSEVLDIDNPDLSKYPKFAEATPLECFMEPGDALFIPAMWFHNVISLQFGVAVNVFWRHLDPCYYDNKDMYGNKDLVPATRAMQIMDRAIKALEELPEEYRDFYARRVVCKVKNKCYSRKHENNFAGSVKKLMGRLGLNDL